MYLTRLPAISGDDYHIHQITRKIFPGDQRVLFQRTDDSIVVISESPAVDATIVSEKVDLTRYEEGKSYSFFVRLNPSKRDSKTHKRVGHEPDYVKAWITEQLNKVGIDARFQYIREVTHRSLKSDTKISHASVLCFGSLTIKDHKSFCKVLAKGIGKGKGLGFGLLNVFG